MCTLGKIVNQKRIEELLEYFDRQDSFKLSDLVEIQVPSVYFPTKGSLVDTLDELVKQGKVRYHKSGELYSKAY